MAQTAVFSIVHLTFDLGQQLKSYNNRPTNCGQHNRIFVKTRLYKYITAWLLWQPLDIYAYVVVWLSIMQDCELLSNIIWHFLFKYVYNNVIRHGWYYSILPTNEAGLANHWPVFGGMSSYHSRLANGWHSAVVSIRQWVVLGSGWH